MRQGWKLSAVDVGVAAMVFAILALLVVPAALHARGREAEMVCLMNVRGLSQAWTLYHEDNDGWLVGGSNYYSGGRRTPYRWVEMPLFNDTDNPGAPPEGYGSPVPNLGTSSSASQTHEWELNGIRAGKLYPYTETEQLYHCPADRNWKKAPHTWAVYISYTGAGLMNSEDFLSRSGWPGTVLPDAWRTVGGAPGGGSLKLALAQKYDDIRSPGGKYMFVEENYYMHGQSIYAGGFVLMSSSYWSWWDWPAAFHGDRTVLGFADAHAELHLWTDMRTICLMKQEPLPGTTQIPGVFQPNNPDLEYMNAGYMACE